MGQVNCKQCQMPILQQTNLNEIVLRKKHLQSKNQNRINVNANTFDLFNKKYSIQSTKQDSQESYLQVTNSQKQKCIVSFQNSFQKIDFEVQKGKKVFLGTSKNCHFLVESLFQQNKFKIQVSFEDLYLKFKDMGVGQGSYVKCAKFRLANDVTHLQQVYLIEGIFIRITATFLNDLERSYQVHIEEIPQGKQQVYNFKLQDLLCGRCQQYFIVNQELSICFQTKMTEEEQLQATFKSRNCWKYLKKETILKQGQTVRLGSSIFRVQRMNYIKIDSNQQEVKIIDQQ